MIGSTLLLITGFSVVIAAETDKPSQTNEDTLVLLHVLFRHGNRTTDDVSSLYLTDPFKDYDFYPYGRGQLTNLGKWTEYNIGLALRAKYDKFLGKTYTPDVLYARSTAFDRTKMSLQLVLASLYSPLGYQLWNPWLFWQPIPYSYNALDNDMLLFGLASSYFANHFNEYSATSEYQSLIAKYQDLFNYISENIGSSITSFMDVFRIYDTFKTHEENGLPIPEWAKSIYPDILAEASSNLYFVQVATKELKQDMAGCLLHKIANDTISKINGSEDLEKRKIFLYSAHDMNVAAVLTTLGLYESSSGMPPYGSYVVFEVHNLGDDYGIQIYFQNYSQGDPLLLTIPGCSNPCPVADFIQLTQKYYPESYECL